MPGEIEQRIQKSMAQLHESVVRQAKSLGWVGVQYLRNAELKVLSGQRSGRRYNVPGTGRVKYDKRTHTAAITYRKYTASAPGEPPAVRTGVFRTSWQMRVEDQEDGVVLRLETAESQKGYPEYLENGTSRMAPRPYVQRIQDLAEPQVRRLYGSIRL